MRINLWLVLVSGVVCAACDNGEMSGLPIDEYSQSASATQDIGGQGCDYFPDMEPIQYIDPQLSINTSSVVPTDQMAMRFVINYTGPNSEFPMLKVGLDVYDDPNTQAITNLHELPDHRHFPLSFSGGDQLVVISGHERYVLEDTGVTFGLPNNEYVQVEGTGNYWHNIERVEPGDCLRVVIERSLGEPDSVGSKMKIEAVPAILSPDEGETYVLDSDIRISLAMLKEGGVISESDGIKRVDYEFVCEGGDEFEISNSRGRWEFDGDVVSSFVAKVVDFTYLNTARNLEEFLELGLSECALSFAIYPMNRPVVSYSYDTLLFNTIDNSDQRYAPFISDVVLNRTINVSF